MENICIYMDIWLIYEQYMVDIWIIHIHICSNYYNYYGVNPHWCHPVNFKVDTGMVSPSVISIGTIVRCLDMFICVIWYVYIYECICMFIYTCLLISMHSEKHRWHELVCSAAAASILPFNRCHCDLRPAKHFAPPRDVASRRRAISGWCDEDLAI